MVAYFACPEKFPLKFTIEGDLPEIHPALNAVPLKNVQDYWCAGHDNSSNYKGCLLRGFMKCFIIHEYQDNF